MVPEFSTKKESEESADYGTCSEPPGSHLYCCCEEMFRVGPG